MPKWIHERAKHLLAKNSGMDKSTAFAVATEQAHKLGKTSVDFGTEQAKDQAIEHYRKPKKSYESKPNPGSLKTPKLASVAQQLVAEMRKEAAATGHEPGQATAIDKRTRSLGAGSAGTALGVTGFVGAALGGNKFDLHTAREKRLTDADNLFGKVRQSTPVPIVEIPLSNAAGYTSGLTPDEIRRAKRTGENLPRGINVTKPHIYLGDLRKVPSVLAHEIGHHELGTGRLGRLLQNRTTTATAAWAPLAALAAGTTAGMSDDSRVQTTAGVAAGAAAAPELLYEAGASLNADKLLRRSGASPKQLSAARKSLASAYGTYLGKGLLTAGLGLGALGATRALRGGPAGSEKLGFQVSEFSGPLNPPSMKYESHMPAFTAPPVKTAGPPPPAAKGKLKKAASPMARLSKVQAVGLPKPKLPAPPGPSIAQIAKPKGFGKPIAGATKTFR